MSDFDALLKRSFAEAHEPADDGFSVSVSHAVARNERVASIRNAAQTGALAVAAASVAVGLYAMAMGFAPDVLASLGFGLARAHSTLSGPMADMTRNIGGALTQVLLVTGAIAGGLVAYRATQD